MIEKTEEMNALLDFYETLLTEKQAEVMKSVLSRRFFTFGNCGNVSDFALGSQVII